MKCLDYNLDEGKMDGESHNNEMNASSFVHKRN